MAFAPRDQLETIVSDNVASFRRRANCAILFLSVPTRFGTRVAFAERGHPSTWAPPEARMNGRRIAPILLTALVLAVLASAPAGHAGIGDALKKKVGDKATKKAEEAVDKATEKPSTEKAEPASGGTESAKPAGDSGAPGVSGDKVSAISTKFDFIPGDSVMFADDFTQDDLGEFPARWKLSTGTFEVAEMEGQRWLRCLSQDGVIRMKMPAMATLPEFWTLEFDFFGVEPLGSGIFVRGIDASDEYAWEASYFNGDQVSFRSGSIFSSTPIEGTVPGRHHLMFMARGTAIKAYLDRQRMVNVPDVSEATGMPNVIEFRMFSTTKPMITNVRFAQGCRPAKDMLATGKLVTYGILFASGSDVVLPESAPILRQIASYLEANPTTRLKITGHTDNVGSSASNLDLSKRRAASVAKVLAEQFAIAANRFATDGKGDTQALASNAKTEGRAMNRRVEFAKL